jgi:hypothetical protein
MLPSRLDLPPQGTSEFEFELIFDLREASGVNLKNMKWFDEPPA